MLSASGSTLVAGSTPAPMATKHIEVLRPFFMGGKPLKVGVVVEIDSKLAAELVHANKAKIVDAPKPVEKPIVAETLEPATRRRSSKDVG